MYVAAINAFPKCRFQACTLANFVQSEGKSFHCVLSRALWSLAAHKNKSVLLDRSCSEARPCFLVAQCWYCLKKKTSQRSSSFPLYRIVLSMTRNSPFCKPRDNLLTRACDTQSFLLSAVRASSARSPSSSTRFGTRLRCPAARLQSSWQASAATQSPRSTSSEVRERGALCVFPLVTFPTKLEVERISLLRTEK